MVLKTFLLSGSLQFGFPAFERAKGLDLYIGTALMLSGVFICV